MTPALEVRGLSFARAGVGPILCDVAFALAVGERVALVGPNGAGKSTLLLHLVGLLPEKLPDTAGAVAYVDGVPLAQETRYAARRKAGLLFQNPDAQLFAAAVLEDVAFGPRQLGLDAATAQGRAMVALERCGAAALADRPPHSLSVGEQRRVCLAGILACEPAILLLDEPTANLDPRGRRELLALLRSLGSAMLVATHDLDFALELCPRALALHGGAIAADGPTEIVLGDAALMERIGLETPWRLR
jgi:cobalt/nickel transport system ATP-binding protein